MLTIDAVCRKLEDRAVEYQQLAQTSNAPDDLLIYSAKMSAFNEASRLVRSLTDGYTLVEE